ncbi:MAG: fatty acid desaturase CarF family protein [Verrucomicrobiota bacterium]
MTLFLLSLVEAILVILLADFIGGVVHWAQDAYIREDTPLVGLSLGKPNMIHHHLPRFMTHHSWWRSSWDLVLLMFILIITMWLTGHLSWQVWLFALVGANSNQIHKWSHRTRAENGRIISFFQDIRVLQSPHHHAIHHTNPKDVRYCPASNMLNPILDFLHFWKGVEWVLRRVFGLKRRVDTSISGNGLPPAWLNEVRSEHAGKFE